MFHVTVLTKLPDGILKIAAFRAKWGEILGDRDCVCMYMGTFDLLVFQVMLGLFGALVSKCVWSIAVPELKNKKSVYEIFHYGTWSEI